MTVCPNATRCLPALAVLFCLCAASAAKGEIAIKLNESKGAVTVDVTGLDKKTLSALPAQSSKWSEVLAVYVERPGESRADRLAMLGASKVENGVVRFTPRFPLLRGVRYRAVFDPSKLPGSAGKPTEVVLSLPKPVRKPTTVVTQVYPTADKLPENQLRFYLHFSAPMRQGRSYQHIKLLDAKGKPIDLPFLELDQELWDPSGKRFTLFLDPGRVKRGLKPREDAGPVLEEGKRYTLVIEQTWRDAEGTPLKESFRKSFRVGAPDDTQPDVKKWKLALPAAGTTAPLRVTLNKPLDHGLLGRMVWVIDSAGKPVAGTIAISDRETVWSFTPERSWAAGSYSLVADTRLEDSAGNSIGRPFEVDVLRPVERQVKQETVKVLFTVSRSK